MHETNVGSSIIGVGRAITRRGDVRIKSVLELQVEAALEAMTAAGVQRGDIGALFTGRMPRAYMSLQFNQALVNELKIAPMISTEVTAHGAGALGTIQLAIMALQAGVIDYALCCTGEASPVWIDVVKGSASWEADLQFEAPYGPTTPSIYALSARRMMHEYGNTAEQWARVAVENRRWALASPHAAMHGRGPLTVDQVVQSRPIASPLRLLDCAVWYPGGIGSAVVVTRSSRAADAPNAIRIMGYGQRTTHEYVAERMGTQGVAPFDIGPSLIRTGAGLAAKQAYEMSEVQAQDVDLVETSAPFSFANVLMLEELGFCNEGEGGAFVQDGGIDFDDGLPFNTSGGYLSFGQSGQGLYLLKEAMDQVLGQAEGKQVPNAEIALVHAHGGPLGSHAVMVIGRES